MPKLTKNLLPSPVKWRSKSLSPALSTVSCSKEQEREYSFGERRECVWKSTVANDGRVRVQWLLEEESVRPTNWHKWRHRSTCSLPTSANLLLFILHLLNLSLLFLVFSKFFMELPLSAMRYSRKRDATLSITLFFVPCSSSFMILNQREPITPKAASKGGGTNLLLCR
jgi:hypothetical protein